MGSLSNLYISQSYQSLAHLGTNQALVSGTMTELQDGIGQSLNIYFDGTNISSSGNIYGANITASVINTGSFVTTSSFNQYTSSQESFNNSATASIIALQNFSSSLDTNFVTEQELASATGSLINQINTKLNTSSFNAYTQSNDDKVNNLINATGSFATTGSNTFVGQQTIQNNLVIEEVGNPLIYTQITQDSLTNKLQVNQVGASGIDFNTNVEMNELTASLTEGYVWVGNSNNQNYQVPTSSFVSATLTGSYATTGSNQFNGNQTITGSVFISSSATSDLVVEGQVFISSSTSGSTNNAKLTISGSAVGTLGGVRGAQVVIQPQSIVLTRGISTSTLSVGNILMSVSGSNSVINAQSMGFTSSFGVVSYQLTGSTDNELWMQADLNGSYLSDYNKATSTYSKAIFFQPNPGTNPAPQFLRSVGITGSLEVSSTFTASLQQGYVWVGDSNNKTVLVATSSFIDTFISGNLVTTSSFNQYTQSIDNRLNNLESTSASVNISISNINAFTASQNIINTNVSASASIYEAKFATIGMQSGSWTGGGTDLSSLNSFTQSQYISNSFFATTGSNTFTGSQIISGTLFVHDPGTDSKAEIMNGQISRFPGQLYSNNFFPQNINSDDGRDIVITSNAGGTNNGGRFIVNTISGSQFTGSVTVQGNVDITGQYLINGVPISGGVSINTGSFVTTSSFQAYTSSNDLRIISLEAFTASANSSLTNINAFTQSLLGTNVWTQSVDARFTTLGNLTGSYATTGSNQFNGSQIITGSLTSSADIIVGGEVTVGNGAGNIITNTALGSGSLQKNTTGNSSTAIGNGTLTWQSQAGNLQNTAVGDQALTLLGSGSTALAAQLQANVAFGYLAGATLVQGTRNTFIGANAGQSVNLVSRNIGIGRGALVALGGTLANGYPGSGSQYNTAIGHNAMFDFISGSNNVYINGGQAAGGSLLSGSSNILLGLESTLPAFMNFSTIIGRGLTTTQIGTTPVNNAVIIADGQQNVLFKRPGLNAITQISSSIDISGSLIASSSVYINSSSAFNQSTGSALVAWDAATGKLTHTTYQSALPALYDIGCFYSTGSVTTTANQSGSFTYDTSLNVDNITVSNGSHINITKTGTYNIQFSIQIDNGAVAADIAVWLKKNGVNVADTATYVTVPSNQKQVLALNLWSSANSGDYFELAYQSTTSNTSFSTIGASGNIPQSPSIIVTINQVR